MVLHHAWCGRVKEQLRSLMYGEMETTRCISGMQGIACAVTAYLSFLRFSLWVLWPCPAAEVGPLTDHEEHMNRLRSGYALLFNFRCTVYAVPFPRFIFSFFLFNWSFCYILKWTNKKPLPGIVLVSACIGFMCTDFSTEKRRLRWYVPTVG